MTQRRTNHDQRRFQRDRELRHLLVEAAAEVVLDVAEEIYTEPEAEAETDDPAQKVADEINRIVAVTVVECGSPEALVRRFLDSHPIYWVGTPNEIGQAVWMSLVAVEIEYAVDQVLRERRLEEAS